MVHVFILAGDRAGQIHDVAEAAGTRCKAFAKIDDTPMIERVIRTLKSSPAIEKILVSIPDYKETKTEALSLYAQFQTGDVERIDPALSPVQSLLTMLDHVEDDTPILVTTADHALLSTNMIHDFVSGFDSDHYDVAAAMLPLDILTAKYPDMRRTRLKFRDGDYKSCNLFLFKNKHTAAALLKFWQIIENQRKTPWKMVKILGLLPLLHYLSGRLSLTRALQYLGQKTATTPQAVILTIPEAAIDVDRISDLEFVRSLTKSDGI